MYVTCLTFTVWSQQRHSNLAVQSHLEVKWLSLLGFQLGKHMVNTHNISQSYIYIPSWIVTFWKPLFTVKLWSGNACQDSYLSVIHLKTQVQLSTVNYGIYIYMFIIQYRVCIQLYSIYYYILTFISIARNMDHMLKNHHKKAVLRGSYLFHKQLTLPKLWRVNIYRSCVHRLSFFPHIMSLCCHLVSMLPKTYGI